MYPYLYNVLVASEELAVKKINLKDSFKLGISTIIIFFELF